MDNSKYISQAIAGALEIMNDQPLTLNEFIDEVMRDYMEQAKCTSSGRKIFRRESLLL